MKSLNLKPMTDKEIKALVKEVKKQRKENPEFKPEIVELSIDCIKKYPKTLNKLK